ncbi:hypothetical protein ACSBR1_040271 [Camellia fascicularis]
MSLLSLEDEEQEFLPSRIVKEVGFWILRCSKDMAIVTFVTCLRVTVDSRILISLIFNILVFLLKIIVYFLDLFPPVKCGRQSKVLRPSRPLGVMVFRPSFTTLIGRLLAPRFMLLFKSVF